MTSAVEISNLLGLEKHNVFLKNMLERKFKGWITLEEHAFEGGLGIRINNWLFKNDASKTIKTINLNY